MNVTKTTLPGVLIIEPRVFSDERGFFLETYSSARFRDAGLPEHFVQDNQSRSKRGVLRGLHYQEPNAQGKLVRCTRGAIFDVAVDIQSGSPTFGKWFGIELTGDDQRMLWVPEGYAHGFCALLDGTDVYYKCTSLYDPRTEHSIVWNDPQIGIEWPIAEPIVSGKDGEAPTLANARALPTFKQP